MKRASISFNRTRHILVNHELEEIHTGTVDKLRDLAGRPVCELASVLTKSCVMLLPELGNAHDRHADLGILEADLGAPSFLRLGTDQHLANLPPVAVTPARARVNVGGDCWAVLPQHRMDTRQRREDESGNVVHVAPSWEPWA